MKCRVCNRSNHYFTTQITFTVLNKSSWTLFILAMEHYKNLDLSSIVTPLNVNRYAELLKLANYNQEETRFLMDDFTRGFDIGYRGPTNRQSRSENIPFTVGDKYELWCKIMTEVKERRYIGPFEEIPFENYIQSPVGLVPKKGKNKTRLIFHLSFCLGEDNPNEQSVNVATPKEWCTVQYQDLDHAVKQCLLVSKEASINFKSKTIVLGKTDLSNVFRVLPLRPDSICWLVLMAKDPRDGRMKFFVDKCLPFRSSISCSHYQRFSNSLKTITVYKTRHKSITNYLDDFLFIAMLKSICDGVIRQFLHLCNDLNIPLAWEKIKWGTTTLVFLGILMDGERLLLGIPLERQQKALKLLNEILDKKKSTIKQLQVLTGYLNFLTKVIFAGCTFMRRMYSKCSQYKTSSSKPLKLYHHVKLDQEFRFDCEIWKVFLANHTEAAVCRPMVDVHSPLIMAKQLEFYSDSSANPVLGMGAVFNRQWF